MSSPLMPDPGAGMPVEAPAPPVQSVNTGWTPGTPRPMSEDDAQLWQARVDRGAAKDKLFHPQAERALKRYAKAIVPEPKGDEFDPLLDYSHVEGRKSQLYHRTPDINLLPIDPQDASVPYQAILPLREKVLNFELGPDRANAKRALHKTLVDTLAASGDMILYLGFEAVKLPVPPDPMGQQPMDSTGQPVTEVIVWSRRFIEAVSSKRLVKPADFRDTDFDKAPWLAVKGCLPLPTAKRLGWTLPGDYAGTAPDRESYFDDGSGSLEYDPSDPQVEYTIVWYKASLYDEAVFNPELYRCLILVKGSEVPALHIDSPYQSLDPQGALTDDSMIGNPIHVDTLRDLPDSAHVPSDLVIGERLSVELTKFRTGLMRNRRGRRPVTLVNERLGPTTIDKIAVNDGPVSIPEEFFDGSAASRAVQVSQAGTEPRDNYTAQQIIQGDWENAMGRSRNQNGQTQARKTTATEARIVQGNSSARERTDEDRVREYFVRMVRKFDAIVQRTMSQQELTKILGGQGAALYDQWKLLPGKYAYKIQPDSGKYVDEEQYRTQKVNEYNLLRKDPLVYGAELVRTVMTALGYDAGKLVPKDQAEEKPESPKVSFSVSLDTAPPVPMKLAIEMLKQQGYLISPELEQALLLQAAMNEQMATMEQEQKHQNPEHGGPANKTERIDKRQESRTGGVQGVGKVA